MLCVEQLLHDIDITGPSSQPDMTQTIEKAAAPKGDKDQDEVDTSTVTSGVSIFVSDPEKAHEALAETRPEPMKGDHTGSDSQQVTSTPPVIAPFTDVSSSKPSLLVTPPPINTEATNKHHNSPRKLLPFTHSAKSGQELEQEMSELKKTDHVWLMFGFKLIQVPTAVDKYLGTKLDDALLKVLERHTADLIEKYSVMPGQ
ncbi:hypothetical protein Tco_1134906 [Tanacetum coccineum]